MQFSRCCSPNSTREEKQVWHRNNWCQHAWHGWFQAPRAHWTRDGSSCYKSVFNTTASFIAHINITTCSTCLNIYSQNTKLLQSVFTVMSIDGETSRVMKGVHHGACDYLLKPVRMKELRNIWQHVYRKKMHEVKEIEGNDSCDDLQIFRNGCEGLEERGLFMRAESDTMRKEKRCR